MFKTIKEIIVFILVLQLIIPCPVYAASVGKFTSVVGKVTQTRGDKVLKPVVNSPIEAKDVINTGVQSTAKMVFDDKSTITLTPNSKMEVKEFAIKGKERRGIFSLTMGKLVANVTKFVGGKNAFEVHTPTAVCGVRGTGFEVAVAESGLSTTITCTSGSLTLTAFNAMGVAVGTTTIVAGQTAVITASGIAIVEGAALGVGGTAVSGASGTGVVGAGSAGAVGGKAMAGGITAGTVAIGTVVVGGVVAAAIAASGGGGGSTPVHHSAPAHH